ncbi:MAG TPA: YraN family protein [Acidobacteriota bacterium]|nr:YraN family protein [Acidobacteriota bacterium]
MEREKGIPIQEELVEVKRGRVIRPCFFAAYTRKAGERAALGRWGEWLALRYLRRSGWDVVARNWSCRVGEVDLIAYGPHHLGFFEVRTRRGPSSVRPEETADEEKLARVEAAAWHFLRRYELEEQPFGLHLIAVETPDLRRYELRHWRL